MQNEHAIVLVPADFEPENRRETWSEHFLFTYKYVNFIFNIY